MGMSLLSAVSVVGWTTFPQCVSLSRPQASESRPLLACALTDNWGAKDIIVHSSLAFCIHISVLSFLSGQMAVAPCLCSVLGVIVEILH